MGVLRENMPPRHGLLLGGLPLYWNPHFDVEGGRGSVFCHRFSEIFGADICFGPQDFCIDDGEGVLAGSYA